ncbi:MAG: formylglycine-generating enzyme family protein [Bryobacterales bacterium]|nr:formylglycine-generating enzyme family protein [Bryobacterales bacterium]
MRGPAVRLLASLTTAAAFLLAAGGEPTLPAAPDGMVLIPEGEFTMGRTFSTSDDESGMRPLILRDDLPAHTVRLSAYWMDATEVTHAAYREFVAATGRRTPYHWLDGKMPEALAEHPVHNVDWGDARAYCEWRGRRLPTEAEWERAARSGLKGKKYPWGDKSPDRGAARYSTPKGSGPVGQFPPNEFGLHDLAGNAAEWCHDWFERTYYERSPVQNPEGPEEGLYRIVRGGAWSDGPNRITVFFRNWVRPNQRTPNLGFRCVQDVPEP